MRNKANELICLSLLVFWTGLLQAQQSHVVVEVDAAKPVGAMTPFWAYFGYDEPNYTTRPDGRKLLAELAQLSPVRVHIRPHNLLTSKGNSLKPDLKWGFTDAYREDKKGRPLYNWTVVDSIVDTYVNLGMKPLMEIGFMPKDLSSKPEPYAHTWSQGGNLWTGWTYPPKDYNKWRELVYQWVKHTVERYGHDEVATWLWEVWNEPDIQYWSGTFEEYCKLYDYAADGLKRACPDCTIGGPHTTSPRSDKARKYLADFITHCVRGTNYATGGTGTPLQYIGFHAKGAPTYADGHIRMNMGAQLRDIDRAFETVNTFPELKGIPIVIGECDPEGCAACSAQRDPKYGYRNGTMYSSYTAASFARIYELMDRHQVNLQGAVSWSFEFEDQAWFAGFRDLATHGVDKPVLNIFRMFGMMTGQRVAVQSTGALTAADIMKNSVTASADVGALATKDQHAMSVMIWNYHDDDVAGDPSSIALTINGLEAQQVMVHHYRVDDRHSNAFERWKSMGRPAQVTDAQYQELERAGQLEMYGSPRWESCAAGKLQLKLDLPRQGVSLIQLTW